MRKTAYLYRTKVSTLSNRLLLRFATLFWFLILLCQIFIGYFLIDGQFTSPLNGALAAFGAATLVVTAFSWSRVVGIRLFSSLFIYRDHFTMRFRGQLKRQFHYADGSRFCLYTHPLRNRSYLRITAPGTETRWVKITDTPAFEKAFAEAGIPLLHNRTGYPTVITIVIMILGCSAYMDSVGLMWIGFAGLFAYLYSIGVFNKPQPPEDQENPHRRSQIAVMGHSLAILGGLWAILAAQQIAFTEADQTFLNAREELHEGKYATGVSKITRIAEQTDTALHLNFAAWVLTTVPDSSLRDSARALEYAKRAIDHETSELKIHGMQDTYACALMGTGRKDDAIAFAEKNRIDKRVDDFKAGRPCEDLALYGQPERGLASEVGPHAKQ